jgi:hypothetical protein
MISGSSLVANRQPVVTLTAPACGFQRRQGAFAADNLDHRLTQLVHLIEGGTSSCRDSACLTEPAAMRPAQAAAS